MKPRALVVVPVAALLLSGWSSRGDGFLDHNPGIALHIVPADRGASCDFTPLPPCNPGEEHLTVRAEAGHDYFIYVLAMDGDVGGRDDTLGVGIGGARFGISYDPRPGSGVDVASWTLCAESEDLTESWPASGSNTRITWDPGPRCPAQAAPGDTDRGVTAVLGVFRVHAYSEDIFQIVPAGTGADRELQVMDCAGNPWPISRLAAGRAYFGPKQGAGFDPCRGPFSPPELFRSLPDPELDQVQIQITPRQRSSFRSGPETAFVLQGRDAVQESGIDFGFERLGFSYARGPWEPPRITLKPPLLRALIDSLLDLPGIEHPADLEQAELSVTVLTTRGPLARAFEALLDRADAAVMLDRYHRLLVDHERAREALEFLGCYEGLYDPPPPVDISGRVEIRYGPSYRDPHGFGARTTLILKNISNETIRGPVYLAVPAGPKSPVILADAGNIAKALPKKFECYDWIDAWSDSTGHARLGAFYDLGAIGLAPGEEGTFPAWFPDQAAPMRKGSFLFAEPEPVR